MNNLSSYAYDGYDQRIQTTFPSKTQGAGANDGTDARRRYGGVTYDTLNRPTGEFVDMTPRRQRDDPSGESGPAGGPMAGSSGGPLRSRAARAA
jgi:hypothetical protein